MTRQSHTTDVGRAEFTPDWLNADVCIENAEIAYEDSLCDEDGPVDTVISSGDLGVLIGLAKIAAPLRDALEHAPSLPASFDQYDRFASAYRVFRDRRIAALAKARGSHD